MTALGLGLDDIDITDPARYRREGYPWAAWDLMRRMAPVHWYDRRGFQPFWAVTKYRDIVEVSRNDALFTNGPRPMIRSAAHDLTKQAIRDEQGLAPDLLEMDPPAHGHFRKALNGFFTPRALKQMEARIEEFAATIVDAAVSRLLDPNAGEGEFDFVRHVSSRLPILVVCNMLGVPEQDVERLLVWTNQWIAPADDEYQAGRGLDQTLRHTTQNLHEYFRGLIEGRRRAPQDDLLSLLLHAKVDGRLMTEPELLSLCVLLLVAGNETTRHAMSGGMLALIEHPDELERLEKEPVRLSSAVEEILRWTSPIVHFSRTATADTEIGGRPIRRGDTVAVFYPSANRDEDVFAAPYRFDVSRSPNDHLAFGGFGAHHCLGASLARIELCIVFRYIIERMPRLELAGPVQRVASGFIGGIKSLPLRAAGR